MVWFCLYAIDVLHKDMSVIRITAPLYQLKITWVASNPPIWRRVIVPSRISLYNLHLVIQALLGWNNSFPQYFENARLRYISTEQSCEIEPLHHRPLSQWGLFFLDLFSMSVVSLFRRIVPSAIDQKEVMLSQILTEPGAVFHYCCVSHSSWRYQLVLEEILPQSQVSESPTCIAGGGACPSEEAIALSACEGNVHILQDREHPRYNELVQSLAGTFDCIPLDIPSINSRLRQLKPTIRAANLVS